MGKNEEYIKRFDEWNIKKKEIDSSITAPFFSEREIWWCSLGVNVATEMDGKNKDFERPVLILKKINNTSAWILPVTSRYKSNTYIYPLRSYGSCVSISQWKNISSKRLLRKETRISEDEFSHIVIRIKFLLTFPDETSPNLSIE